VVLQEQSEVPAIESARQARMYPAVQSLAGEIRAADATPILLQTWAHRDGLLADGMGYVEMQSAIDTGYATIGDQLGVAVAPAGQAWATVLRQDPTIALWQADGCHPSAAGTYLAACVLYARIFEASPVGIPDTEGFPVDLARAAGRRRPALKGDRPQGQATSPSNGFPNHWVIATGPVVKPGRAQFDWAADAVRAPGIQTGRPFRVLAFEPPVIWPHW